MFVIFWESKKKAVQNKNNVFQYSITLPSWLENAIRTRNLVHILILCNPNFYLGLRSFYFSTQYFFYVTAFIG